MSVLSNGQFPTSTLNTNAVAAITQRAQTAVDPAVLNNQDLLGLEDATRASTGYARRRILTNSMRTGQTPGLA